MPDREQQVRLPEPHAAVDEQRVVGPGRRRFGHRHRRGVREPVRRTGHERVERVAGCAGQGRRRGFLRLCGRRRLGRALARVGFQTNLHRRSGCGARRVPDHREVVLLEPVAHVVGGSQELEDAGFELAGPDVREPHVERAVREVVPGALHDARPHHVGRGIDLRHRSVIHNAFPHVGNVLFVWGKWGPAPGKWRG